MSKESAFEVGRLYGPIKQIADTLTASQKDVFVRLPALRAYYPCGIRAGNGALIEHGGGGPSLTQVGTCPTGYDGDAYVTTGTGTNHFQQSGVGGFTGTETFVASSIRGFTIGGWFLIPATPAGFEGLVSRDGSSPSRGYYLALDSSNNVKFSMSGNGTSTVFATSSPAPVASWTFLVGRFIPSNEVAVFVDAAKVVNTTSIPAQSFASTANFNIGTVDDVAGQVFSGNARDIFICAAALSDALLEEVRIASVP
jgi:hypothetical protein